jgi:putative flavoprotein involved in K+ transport
VVGAGNSAVQIAVEVAQVARVTLATRSSIRFTPQRMLGRDLFSLVALTGIERLPLGQWRRLQEPRVVIDAGAYKRAIAQGLPDRQAMFQSFTPNGVIWSDGRTEMVDAVIFATGYRPNLAYLVPLAALDATGTPVQRAGISLTIPGLYYVGLTGQRTFVSATLRGVGPDAAYVVRHLRQYLQRIPDRSEA